MIWQKELSGEELNFALSWLSNTKTLIEQLGDRSYFYKQRVENLILVEMQGKRRLSLLKRLHGRFSKLRREEEWEVIENVRETD